jgi:hypothetical protein
MKKLFCAFTVSLLIAAALSANAPRKFSSPVVARPPSAAAPVQFASKEGGFSVKLPEEPKTSSQDVDTDVGKVTMYAFTVETNSGNTAYMVLYSDFPTIPDPANAIDRAINGQVTNFKGTIVTDKKVTLNGWPGRTVRIESADVIVLSSVYLAGNRLYQVMFLTGKGDTIPADALEFQSTFEITKSAPAK